MKKYELLLENGRQEGIFDSTEGRVVFENGKAIVDENVAFHFARIQGFRVGLAVKEETQEEEKKSPGRPKKI